MDHQKRHFFSSNPFERRIIGIVLLSAIIPFAFAAAFFFFMFRDLINFYVQSAVADYFLNRFFILSVILFFYYSFFIGVITYFFVRRLLGALPRVLTELDNRISGKSKGPIALRKGDYGKELIDRVNILIAKIDSVRDTVDRS